MWQKSLDFFKNQQSFEQTRRFTCWLKTVWKENFLPWPAPGEPSVRRALQKQVPLFILFTLRQSIFKLFQSLTSKYFRSKFKFVLNHQVTPKGLKSRTHCPNTTEATSVPWCRLLPWISGPLSTVSAVIRCQIHILVQLLNRPLSQTTTPEVECPRTPEIDTMLQWKLQATAF